MNKNSEQGIFMVLGAVFAFVLITLTAVVLVLGYFTTGAAKYQEVADLAAQASLSRFVHVDPALTPSPPPQNQWYSLKAEAARAEADQVLRGNKVLSIETLEGVIHDGVTDPNAKGVIELGNWFSEPPPAGTPTPACAGSGGIYPCFQKNPPPTIFASAPQVNAARLTLNNKTSSSPFCSILGGCEKDISTTSIAAVIPRCMVFATDISGSVYLSTHAISTAFRYLRRPANCTNTSDPNYDWCLATRCSQGGNNRAVCMVDPSDYNATIYTGKPVFRYRSLVDARVTLPSPPNSAALVDCTEPTAYRNNESVIWCNMDPLRPTGAPPPGFVAKEHYQSDFGKRTVTYANGTSEDFMVETLVVPQAAPEPYRGAEPFSSLFLAANAGFRAIDATLTSNDKGKIVSFGGKIKGSFPWPGATPAMSSDFGPLIQVTNLSNRGTILGLDGTNTPIPRDPEQRPNFLDIQAFAPETYGDPYEGFTNTVIAIEDALESLKSCPANSRKLVFLATDMISSCQRNAGQGTVDPTQYECKAVGSGAYDSYKIATSQTFSNGPTSLLTKLKEFRVSVSVIQAGDYLGLNYRNKKSPDNTHFLNFLEAYGLGLGGQLSAGGDVMNGFADVDPNKLFFDTNPGFPTGFTPDPNPDLANRQAYENLDKPGFFFRQPIGLAADLALQTGGVYCPLLKSCGASCYDSDGNLKESCRSGTFQDCAPQNLSVGEQAAKCVLDALTGDPFMLVTEGP